MTARHRTHLEAIEAALANLEMMHKVAMMKANGLMDRDLVPEYRGFARGMLEAISALKSELAAVETPKGDES